MASKKQDQQNNVKKRGRPPKRSLENLIPWEKGTSGNLSGRPRSVLRLLEEKIGTEFQISLPKSDKTHLLEVLLELNIRDLTRLSESKDAPAFLSIAAKAILDDYSNGSLRTIETIFNRAYGKPHVQTPDKPEDLDPLAELMKSNANG